MFQNFYLNTNKMAVPYCIAQFLNISNFGVCSTNIFFKFEFSKLILCEYCLADYEIRYQNCF